ncbi:MAG: sporulation protein YqfD [Clostridia bacterium]|nr:sporulation protein YqfD [Clostridia bacterium]
MFLKILINYILGYLNIEVEGFYIERFINMCISKGFFLWNINRKKSSIMTVNIGIEDFKKIKEVVKKSGCKIKINYKKGVPFIFNKYKKRKIFLGICILIFIVIFILSNYIWNIEIIGLSKINEDEIYKSLESNGLKIGASKEKIDVKTIINNIRLDREDIAWIGIDIKGTNAKINIVEATEKPEIIKEEDYCNIIADKKGIITKINALNGTAQVKVR